MNNAKTTIAGFFIVLNMASLGQTKTFYVDATNGNDNLDGKSVNTAWRTLNKVNNLAFAPGDTILLRRGEIWYETLEPSSSGAPGQFIIFGAYGVGEKPIIRGDSGGDGIEIRNSGGRSYLVFENLHIQEVGDYDIHFGIVFWHQGPSSTHIIIQDCEVENSGRSNIMIGNVDSLIIRRVVSHGARAEHGIYIDGAVPSGTDNPLVEDCVIFSNNQNGIQLNTNGTYRPTNPTIRRNKIYANGHNGLNDLGSLDGLYVYNLIYDNAHGAIRLSCDNCALPSSGARIYNNTLRTVVQTAGFKPGFFVHSSAEIDAFKNNIIHHRDSNHYALFVENPRDAKFDKNLYYFEAAANKMIAFNDLYYNGFQAYRSGSGQDQSSLEADPLFEDPLLEDFRLKDTSPAIDGGVDVEITQDHDKNPVPNGPSPDIGAFERADRLLPPAPTNLRARFR